jgi:aldehyde:ferredoxin oxidoreductase
MFGYMGKVLRVNLTEGSVKVEPLDLKMAQKYVGTRGIGVKTYIDEVDPKIDPLNIDNKLIIATGPLTGAPIPCSGRFMVVSKSPLTGGIAISNSGGKWGPQFKNAGYDMIILEGKSDKPVYINIEDDKVEIKDASNLWGKVSSDVTKELKKVHEGSKVLCIGPAGENLSLNAAIMNDVDRAAGRGGVGAILGSKNLKAITVKGTGKMNIFDVEKTKEVNKRALVKLKENPTSGEGLGTFGTAVLVNIMNEHGIFPVNNFQESYTELADEISGETMTKDTLVRKNPCFRCPIACGRWVKMADGREIGGPEYETLWSFGADCGIYDLDAISQANEICNEYGMDTISAGSTIASAMELYQRGYIKDEEIAADGLSLKFGDTNSMVGWTKKMALKEGFGAKLALGSFRLCESYGHPEFSITVKKLEIPAYDPRGAQGQGLAFATNNRGGCHVKGYMINPEILGHPVKLDPHTTEGKGAFTMMIHDATTVVDMIGLCTFAGYALTVDDYAEMYNVICGDVFTGETLQLAGERVWNLEKIFNLRAGLTKADDTLPKRLLEEPIVNGPSKGQVNKLDELMPQYYEARGWDKDGIPTHDRLVKLGLEEYEGTF